MRRLTTIAAIILAVFAATATPVRAQAPGKIYRIGVLTRIEWPLRPTLFKRRELAMQSELAQRGFVEGRNLVFDVHQGPAERLPDLARELVATHPDVIYAVGLPEAVAAHSATEAIPIIATSSLLLESGLVASLARPGGNVSGVTFFTAELNVKRLALLHELVPAALRVALLGDPSYMPAPHIADLTAAAHNLGLAVEVIEVRRQEEIGDSVRRARTAGVDAVNVLTASILLNAADVLATAAIDVGLPTICSWREMAEAGCLASYGPPMVEIFRTVGMQIARILHGARVAEIPVEQSTNIELTLNLKTAKTLGLTVSPSLLASADEVIE